MPVAYVDYFTVQYIWTQYVVYSYVLLLVQYMQYVSRDTQPRKHHVTYD